MDTLDLTKGGPLGDVAVPYCESIIKTRQGTAAVVKNLSVCGKFAHSFIPTTVVTVVHLTLLLKLKQRKS